MNLQKALLIVFEGIDGSGKTTLSKMFYSYIKEKGYEAVWLSEPSDSEWGKKIRELAVSMEKIPIEDELKYFIEDRKWDVRENILPALKNNKNVILDRYYFSTACYQGARGFDMEKIIQENLQFAPQPDVTFVIDVDVNTALERISQNRDSKVKLFEKKEFLQKVRENRARSPMPISWPTTT